MAIQPTSTSVEVYLKMAGEKRVDPLALLHRDELQSVNVGLSAPGVTRSGAEYDPADSRPSHQHESFA